MKNAIKLPNGFFNKKYSVFINVEVGKSNELRKSTVTNCGEILVNTMTKTLYRINFSNNTFSWHIA